PIRRSPHAGGCTFAEDPTRTCASVRPVWTAAIDPRVLAVRAWPARAPALQSFDLRDFKARVARYQDAEHARIDAEGLVVRLDVIAGTLLAGPVLLAFEIRDDPRLRAQLSTIRAFCELRRGKRAPSGSHQRVAP